MKNKRMLSDVLKSRTTGFYMGFLAAIFLFVTDIIFLAVDMRDITFSFVTFGLILVGVLLEMITIFADFSGIKLLSTIVFGMGFAYHLKTGLPSVSDVWNGVHFIGGNATMAVVFAALFAVGLLVSIISCFFEDKIEK